KLFSAPRDRDGRQRPLGHAPGPAPRRRPPRRGRGRAAHGRGRTRARRRRAHAVRLLGRQLEATGGRSRRVDAPPRPLPPHRDAPPRAERRATRADRASRPAAGAGPGRHRRRRARHRARCPAPLATRGGLLLPLGDRRRRGPAGRGSPDSHGRRATAVGLPVVGVRIRGAVFHRHDVARLRGGRARRGGRRISGARAALRRAAGSGGGMSAVSGRTRLGLEILGAGAALGIWGDVLLRAVPWGLNALLCTAGLVAAAAGLARRHRVAVSSDAPWLAAAALIIASNFVARDSSPLRAFDTIGLTIVFAVAFLRDRKSTRLNSSHVSISYAVFCLKKNSMLSDGGKLTSARLNIVLCSGTTKRDTECL